jgi:Leucine rich repeat
VNDEVQPAKPSVSDKPKRRWFQFSLKTLLVALTLLCLGPGGYLTYERARRQRQWRIADEIERMGGELAYVPPNARGRYWSEGILGDEIELIGVIFSGNGGLTDDDLALLEAFPNLQQLTLSHTKISDAGLVHIKKLKQLEWLDLSQTRVTDAGLVHIEGLNKLETLNSEIRQ